MEFVIAVFVGLWVAGAGVLAYYRLCKDFKDVEKDLKKEDKEVSE